MPATAGGMTSGSSTMVTSSARPRKRRVASNHAAGVPIAITASSASPLHSKLSRSASTAASSPSALTRSRGGASANTATTGRARKATATASAAPQATANGRAIISAR